MRFVRFTSTFGLILMAFSLLPAQSVTVGGIVSDSASSGPLAAVRVEVSLTTDPGTVHTVFSDAAGAWSYTFEVSGVSDRRSLPLSFEVGQNYPNPFNPSTTISFAIPSDGPVSISVHNILGQTVDERSYMLGAGSYSVVWNGRGAAGPLFYTVRAGGHSVTKKMLQLDGGTGSGLGPVSSAGGVSRIVKKMASGSIVVQASKLGYETDSVVVPFADNGAVHFSLPTVHQAAFVFDLHNDIAELMVDGYQMGERHTSHQSDLPRFRDGGVDAQMMVLWTDPDEFFATAFQRTMQMYDTCTAQIARNSSVVGLARTVDEIRAVNDSGKIAMVLCAEGGHAIEEDLNKLITLHQLGIRYMTITWNNSTSWATSAADPASGTKGLSEFGKQVIRTMDSLGMIIDVSHTGIKTIADILAVTTHPIIASHSGARAVRDHYRNLTDDQIKAIAAGGGVIGVVFYTYFISSAAASSVTIDTVVKHIDHIRDLVGVDHIAIGSDYDGGITAPVGLENVSKLGNLTMALLQKGYSREDVRKILGGNYLRVFGEVCH